MRTFLRGARSGAPAAVATIAIMYVGAWLGAITPVPTLLEEPLLQAMPGPLFGFLIDTLQHAGKVVEEIGLILAMVAGLIILAGLHTTSVERWRLPATRLLPAAIGWAGTIFVVLPMGGEGFGGVSAGISTPLVWAVVYLVYSGLMEAADQSARPRTSADFDPTRRRLLSLLPAGAALAGTALVGYRMVPGWIEAILAPPESGQAGRGSEITPVASFYIVSKNFVDPAVPLTGWSLGVRGLVDRPLRLSYEELRSLPGSAQTVTLECISNLVGGDLMSTNVFTGVPLRELVARALPRAEGDALAFHCRDGYVETLPFSDAKESPEILVAYELGGQPLPQRHGFPARVVVPGHYGLKSAKWLDWIEVTRGERKGHWQQQGFDRRATVKTTARIDTPREGAILPAGSVALAGVAFAGGRGISAVEWSPDGGTTWSPAQLREPRSRYTWTLWDATWAAPRPGPRTLLVRARDGDGALQTSIPASSFPSGTSGYHRVRVNVAA